MTPLRVLCIYFVQPVSDIQAVAEIFYRATPYVTWRGQDALFLEISKCTSLYKESTFLARARATLRRIGLEAHLAMANDVSTAFGLAFFRLENKLQLPVEAISFYVDPLADRSVGLEKARGIETKTRAIEMAQTLRLMGVKTIGDFLKLHPRELASRFSRFGLLAHLRAQGQSDVVWPPFHPREHIVERFVFDEEAPAQNLETIYFPLRPMIERMVLRLRARGLRARQIDLILQQEHAENASSEGSYEKRFSIFIQLPHVSSKVIFQILREKLENGVRVKGPDNEPFFQRPISDVRLEVIETAPHSLTQKNLFDQKKEEHEESFFQLVSRLATRLGPAAVFFAEPHANYLPEKNWIAREDASSTLSLAAQREGGGGEHGMTSPKLNNALILPERPLRLLPTPIPLQWTSNQWTVQNKEVLLTDWWNSTTSVERVYFRLVSKDPATPDLWVFRKTTPDSNATYFLHGVFE